ncbi:hypothetical protein [Neogemmobacter tilapiae]|uniref:Uncharacterized protein n=1 Tax=Neogemmobacter tilapiae TaxID=875041 RepID=A0A918WPU4_9RHOB|nr:hypothetical protein [Gemmobacter tilapiae]GHC66425.1 hypothetical protein GCM10007315_33950 [Gemmobacter tilapiae]
MGLGLALDASFWAERGKVLGRRKDFGFRGVARGIAKRLWLCDGGLANREGVWQVGFAYGALVEVGDQIVFFEHESKYLASFDTVQFDIFRATL